MKHTLSGIYKTCSSCQRDLSGRCFVYSQHSEDKFRDQCRTCDSYKPKGSPSLSSVLDIEERLDRIFSKGLGLFPDPENHRIQFELYIHTEMQSQGLLDTWRPPIWFHKSSIRKGTQ